MANLNWTPHCTIIERSVPGHQALPVVYPWSMWPVVRGITAAWNYQYTIISAYQWDPRMTTLARIYPTRAERLMARIHCEVT